MSDLLIMQLQDEITQLRRDIQRQQVEIERLGEKLQAARKRISDLITPSEAAGQAEQGKQEG